MKSVKHSAFIGPASAFILLILFTASNCQNSSVVFTDTSTSTVPSPTMPPPTTFSTSSLSTSLQITSSAAVPPTSSLQITSLAAVPPTSSLQITSLAVVPQTTSLPRTVDSSPNNPTQTSTIDTFGSSTVIVGSAPQYEPYPISVVLPSENFDFTGFPPVSQLVSGNAEFMEKYNFSTVPDLPIATPYQSRSSVDCTSINANTCSWMCGGCTRPDDIVSCPNNDDWALTFDDGPSRNSLNVLSYLQDNNIKATFSLIGSQIIQFPTIALAEFQLGHQVIVHTWSHRALTSLSTPVIIAELEWTALAIEKVLGVRPLYFRPPYGDIDDRVREIAKILGLRPILWNYDSRDFSSPSSSMEAEAGRTASDWRSRSRGIISLQHDLVSSTVLFSPYIADNIAQAGMKLKSVAECIGDANPYAYSFNDTFMPYVSTFTPTTTMSTTTSVGTGTIQTRSSALKSSSLFIFFQASAFICFIVYMI